MGDNTTCNEPKQSQEMTKGLMPPLGRAERGLRHSPAACPVILKLHLSHVMEGGLHSSVTLLCIIVHVAHVLASCIKCLQTRKPILTTCKSFSTYICAQGLAIQHMLPQTHTHKNTHTHARTHARTQMSAQENVSRHTHCTHTAQQLRAVDPAVVRRPECCTA